MSRLSKNIIYNLFGQTVLLIFGFISVGYVFKQLGSDVLGIIYFALIMSNTMTSILELGISSVTVREVAGKSSKNPSYIHNFIRTASLFYWGGYIIFSIIIYFTVPLIVDYWINLKTLDRESAVFFLRILWIFAFLNLPRTLYSSIFRGLERMEFNNIIDTLITALQQIGIIVIIGLGGGFLPLAYWLSTSFVIWIGIYIIFTKRFFPWKTFIPRFFPIIVEKNKGYALKMLSISILSIIQTQADKLIISRFLPLGFVGYYGTLYSSLSRGSLLVDAISQAAFPSFSVLFENKAKEDLLTRYWKLQDLVVILTLPIFAFLPFFATPLFTYVFNAEIAQDLFLTVIFLSIGFYLHGTLTIPYFFSLAVGKPEISVRTNFLALFIVLPVTIGLIYFFGLAGAAFSWLFYNLFVYFYAIPRICRECLKIPSQEWYWHVGRILILGFLIFGSALSLLVFFDADSSLFLALAYIVGLMLFLMLSFKLARKELKLISFKYLNEKVRNKIL